MALRAVRPRKLWLAGSLGSYASVSTIFAAIRPRLGIDRTST